LVTQKVRRQIGINAVIATSGDSCATRIETPSAMPFGFLGNTLHCTLGYLSSDWLVSYLVAAVIFSVGSLITSHIYPPEQIVDNSPSTAPALVPAVVQPERKLVGQVTSLVDCHWNDSHTVAHLGCRVAVGDEFVLASGLAEITYDTGAKVLLQGPVTYQVDSLRGGFLSVGKLTACVEKKEVGAQKSNFQSLMPNSSLFAVRTPTAVVTDLGTEFGVEVSDTGETQSHVFRGTVQLQQTGADAKPLGDSVILHANEAACVKIKRNAQNNIEKNSNAKSSDKKESDAKKSVFVLARGEFDAKAFVLPSQMRQYAEEQRLKPYHRWQAYCQELRKDPSLVAYYTFDQLSPDASTSVLPNQSAAGHALDGRAESGEWVNGRFANKLAVYFHGPNSGDRIVLPHPERFEFPGEFSVAVWFKVNKFTSLCQALITKGEGSWRVQRNITANQLSFDTNCDGCVKTYMTIGRSNVVEGQWHLVVAVYMPQGKTAHKYLYLDGRLDAEEDSPFPRTENHTPVCIGGNLNPKCVGREFFGWIDEIAVFSRAMSAKEVAAMFQAGNPENGP
jgi:hypothetical protein